MINDTDLQLLVSSKSELTGAVRPAADLAMNGLRGSAHAMSLDKWNE